MPGLKVLDNPDQLQRHGDTLEVSLWYPRCDGHAKAIEVDLVDVRATDSIRVEFDFDRDGWSIKQASTFEFSEEDTVRDPDWQEVAFVPAWAREKGTNEE